MNALEAMVMLNNAPYDDKPSKVNPNLTRKQVVDIMKAPLMSGSKRGIKQNGELDDLLTKRVWQAYKDQRRPRY